MAFFLLSSRFAHHSVSLAKHSEFSSRNCLHVCVCVNRHTHTHTHIYTLYTASAKYIYYIYIYINIRNISPPPPPETCFLVFDFFFFCTQRIGHFRIFTDIFANEFWSPGLWVQRRRWHRCPRLPAADGGRDARTSLRSTSIRYHWARVFLEWIVRR